MTLFVVFVVAPAIASIVAATGWAIDASAYDNRVMRNTELADRAVGGLEAKQVRPIVEDVAATVSSSPVILDVPWGTESVPAATLGVTVDVDATTAAVVDAGRDGDVLERGFRWLGSLLDPSEVDPVLQFDADVAARALRSLEGSRRREPTEPELEFGAAEGFGVVAGASGREIDVDGALARLTDRVRRGEIGRSVPIDQHELAPRISASAADELAARATELTEGELTIAIGFIDAPVPKLAFGEALRFDPGASPPALAVAEADVMKGLVFLTSLNPDIGAEPIDARITVDAANRVVIDPGQPGTTCCTDASPRAVADVLLADGDTARIEFEPVPGDRGPAWADGLGIREMVTEFTTRHAPGQSRVRNIHRMADLVRGAIIEPGEVFSLNERVGRRTVENGFVSGGVIYNGQFTNDIGGGVSQFATTLFNAAFFAGLEFVDYRSHTVYLSRYPYGREATVSWPTPDLKIRNTTPHAILIWPTYDDSSITVRMFSTKTVEVSQSGQWTGRGASWCSVTTERTIRHLDDGRSEVDNVVASYRGC